MTPTLKISAQEAHRAAMDNQRLMNGSRYAPPMLDMVERASEQARVYIFNVGPWMQQRLMGSLGTYTIPACPEGKEYSAPVVIEGIVSELYPINEGEFKRTMEDGYAVAMQVLGVGPHLSPRNSFVPYGVFVSRNERPSKEEITAARAKLAEKFLELVTEADLAYANGPKAAEETIRPETHFVAARALGKTAVDCPWLKNAQVPAERKECFGCGAQYKVGILKCACGAVLDKKRYDEAVKNGLFAA